MLDSELELMVKAQENKQLRNRVRGLKIIIYAMTIVLVAFIVIAAVLASMVKP